MDEKLFLGYEIGSGKQVFIPCFHFLITGQTRLSGKTTLLKALAKQVIKHGYKVLVLDTKTNIADYEGFGKDVPVCLRQTTDALVLQGLMESQFQRKITKIFGTLTEIAENAATFEDIIKNAEAKLEKKRTNSWAQDACRTIIDLMRRVIEQTKAVETTTELELPHEINRMAINMFQIEAQQLVAKTVFEDALRKYKKLIIILDESAKFLPQKYMSACGRAIQDFVTQSGATFCWLWMSTQFLATASKDQMKAMPVKLLGTQDHDTECQHTLDLIPTGGSRGSPFTIDFIMRLKLGHFVVVTKDSTKIAYAVPENADKNECLEVALGKREPKDIHYSYLTDVEERPVKPKVNDNEVIVIVEDEPKTTIPTIIKTEPHETDKKLKRQRPFINWGDRIELLTNNMNGLTEKMIGLNTKAIDFDRRLTELAIAFDQFKTMPMSLVTSEINMRVNKKIMNYELSDDTLTGKIMMLAKEGFLNNWHTSIQIKTKLNEKWNVPDAIDYALNDLAKSNFLVKRKTDRYEWKLAQNIRFVE